MQIRGVWCRASLAIAGALAMAAAAGATEPAGFVAVAEGQVKLQASEGSTFRAAAVDDDVAMGDTVRTGRDSRAKLMMVDDTTITMGDETDLLIDHYLVGKKAASEPSRIELLKGHVRTRVAKGFGGETKFEMYTPTAVIGVKGTLWNSWYPVLGGSSWFCVVSGVIGAKNRNSAIPGSLDLTQGQCCEVPPDGPPQRASLPPGLTPVSASRSPDAPVPPAAMPTGPDRPGSKPSPPEPRDRYIDSPNDNPTHQIPNSQQGGGY